MSTTMTVKGQVTIPKAVRDHAGLKPGSRVEVTSPRLGEIVIMPAADDREAERTRRLAKAAALFQANDPYAHMTTDEYMAMIREPVGDYLSDPAVPHSRA